MVTVQASLENRLSTAKPKADHETRMIAFARSVSRAVVTRLPCCQPRCLSTPRREASESLSTLQLSCSQGQNCRHLKKEKYINIHCLSKLLEHANETFKALAINGRLTSTRNSSTSLSSFSQSHRSNAPQLLFFTPMHACSFTVRVLAAWTALSSTRSSSPKRRVHSPSRWS